MSLKDSFTEGQAYVALSRATSIQGLELTSFKASSMRCSRVVLDFYRRCGSQTVGEAADEGDVDDEVVLERVEDDDERAERRQKEAEEEGRMIDLTDDVSPVASLRRLVGRCSAGLHLRLRTSATRILAPSFAHPHSNWPSRRLLLDTLPHACTPSHPAPHCSHTRLNTRRTDTPALSLALMNILFFSPSPLSPCTLLTTADFICATNCTSAELSHQTQHTPHRAHTALYSAPEHAVSFTRPTSTVLLTTTATAPTNCTSAALSRQSQAQRST